MTGRSGIVALVSVALAVEHVAAAQAPRATGGLTSVPGIKVGQHTLTARPTGCTVVIVERGAVAGVDVRGASPGTRETDLLDPVNSVQQIHAIVLAGGSAFGLDAATGVMRFLDEKNIGFKSDFWKDSVGTINVPIVPAAILIDLGVGGNPKVRPDADCGYRAAADAGTGPIAEGNVGAGAGATIGKLAGPGRAMKGGLGTASMTFADGVIVAALVAVNAVGDVIDPATGQVVAGVRTPDGRGLADARRLLRAGEAGRPPIGGNTTLGVVATNATLSKAQATKVAQMAQDGFARTIVPAHTTGDGDTIFAIATGERAGEPNVSRIGAAAADVVSQAILRAILQAEGVAGYPAARDLKR
jgi:L-aminopeptidase/D-esterase-like protein